MDIKEISANSLSFIGDAVYTLAVREYFISNKYQSSKSLQKLCNRYNCAAGQTKVFNRLSIEGFFTEEELYINESNIVSQEACDEPLEWSGLPADACTLKAQEHSRSCRTSHRSWRAVRDPRRTAGQ